MAVYDSRHINQMKQDAIRRSQETNRRNSISAHYSEGKNEEIKKANEEHTEKQRSYIIERKHNKKDFNDILKNIFDGKIDNDKLIIIALMILLAKEGADIKLIIALGYILL